MCPDGIIYHLYGPEEGRRNDNHLLDASGLLDRCARNANKSVDDSSYYLYGDPAYPSSRYLLSPFAKGENITPTEHIFNVKMAQVRESVEWGFGGILRLWAYLDHRTGQKVFLSPIGLEYRVAVILTNAHVCLYGSQISTFFSCKPPTLEEYFKD